MMRAGTAANAQYAYILATTTNTNGFRYQYRLTTGGGRRPDPPARQQRHPHLVAPGADG